MKNYYWSLESWGDAYPPKNADEIIEIANAAIDRFIYDNPDADDDTIAAFSEKMWEDYCSGGWDRKALATIETEIGTATIYYNGPGAPITAEKDDIVEDKEFVPWNLQEAEDWVFASYRYDWGLEWISE